MEGGGERRDEKKKEGDMHTRLLRSGENGVGEGGSFPAIRLCFLRFIEGCR